MHFHDDCHDNGVDDDDSSDYVEDDDEYTDDEDEYDDQYANVPPADADEDIAGMDGDDNDQGDND